VPRLLVIVPDYITAILKKGEYQPRYYNPGEVFDHVDILMTNGDRPDVEALRRTVGKASLAIHNHPEPPDTDHWKWWLFTDRLLERWAAPGVDLARALAPDLIRIHGADFNGFLASSIRKQLGIPYVVSLHINPDINPTRRLLLPHLTPSQRRHNALFEHVERETLANASLVMPVYQPILPYLERMGVERTEVCYNVLNGDHLRAKTDYRRHGAGRIICVGRLFEDKYPDKLIKAAAALPGVELVIVGDGPARPSLEKLVEELKVADRVIFRPSVPNDELCAELPGFDVFAVHTEFWELNKSVLEALLAGLPIVINRRKGLPVPELQGDFVCSVENSVEGYETALRRLLGDDETREALGRRAFAHAQSHWAPEVTEARFAAIYRSTMRKDAAHVA
jgi:glycosyltransferase involved in cell wall biosynthesis